MSDRRYVFELGQIVVATRELKPPYGSAIAIGERFEVRRRFPKYTLRHVATGTVVRGVSEAHLRALTEDEEAAREG